MLTEEEKQFIVYWEENRLRRKRVVRNLSVGLPLASVLVIATFVNFFSSWYKKAEQERNEQLQQHDGSLMLVLIIACVLIVLFVTIFGARYKWDQYEQRYRELLARKEKP